MKPAHHEAPRNIITHAEQKVKEKMYGKMTKNVYPDLVILRIKKVLTFYPGCGIIIPERERETYRTLKGAISMYKDYLEIMGDLWEEVEAALAAEEE